jgi:hypothetical protein
VLSKFDSELEIRQAPVADAMKTGHWFDAVKNRSFVVFIKLNF